MGTLTLRPQTFQAPLSPATAWLLADCMEMRGKQDLWTRQRPETLAALREQAIVHSVESSNRIEGVTVAPQRLRPLALRRTRPRDRSEEELAGYRKALDWIFARSSRVAVDETLILHLHALAQGGTTGDAGRFKEKDNEIIELKPGVGRVVRFRPTPAREAPRAIRELCASFELLSSERAAPPLLLVATFVFDFLCIHPFRDGNGRVSRLLTTLLLEREGFVVSQFVSLERLIEETKEDYYRVLGTCSQRWSEGRNPIAPWWTYFLSIVRRGYTAFAGKVDRPIAGGTKTELVRQAAMGQVGAFALADLRAELPAVSPQMIRKVLADLRNEGALRSSGRGRAARWEIIRK